MYKRNCRQRRLCQIPSIVEDEDNGIGSSSDIEKSSASNTAAGKFIDRKERIDDYLEGIRALEKEGDRQGVLRRRLGGVAYSLEQLSQGTNNG